MGGALEQGRISGQVIFLVFFRPLLPCAHASSRPSFFELQTRRIPVNESPLLEARSLLVKEQVESGAGARGGDDAGRGGVCVCVAAAIERSSPAAAAAVAVGGSTDADAHAWWRYVTDKMIPMREKIRRNKEGRQRKQRGEAAPFVR